MADIDKEKLYSEYHGKVYSYLVSKLCNKENAEDLCSDVFVKIYSHLDEFDSTQASVSTWIYSITRNTLYDYYRTSHELAELDENTSEEGLLEDSICSDETLEELAAALKTLSEKERDLILLYYYGGNSLKETADKIGISYSYAKALHSTALKNLRKKIDF